MAFFFHFLSTVENNMLSCFKEITLSYFLTGLVLDNVPFHQHRLRLTSYETGFFRDG